MSKLASGDKTATDELDTFRKDVATFVRIYAFMTQIVDYGDAGLETLNLPATAGAADPAGEPHRRDRPVRRDPRQDQADRQGSTDIGRGTRTGLEGTTQAGSGARRDPRMVAFQQVIDRSTTCSATKTSPPARRRTWACDRATRRP